MKPCDVDGCETPDVVPNPCFVCKKSACRNHTRIISGHRFGDGLFVDVTIFVCHDCLKNELTDDLWPKRFEDGWKILADVSASRMARHMKQIRDEHLASKRRFSA